VITDEVELVMRKHLPVTVEGETICLCDVTKRFHGPVGQRLHVAVELRRAGLLAPENADGGDRD
jgi:hypothetical protein